MAVPLFDTATPLAPLRASIDAAIARVLDSGWYILGKEVSAFEAGFAAAMGARWSLGVASGTDAIELALRALGIGSGDAVLTVSHTAVATAAAIARAGATPLFVDIDPHRYTMDPASLEAALATEAGRRAKALVVVHIYGQPADMPALAALADAHGLALVEDCAQAHGARLHGRPVGSWGRLGCYSFYPTKNLGALGDGGAITGDAPALEQALRLLREYGWRRRYISEEAGFNSRLDELQAAVLNAKLPGLEAENARRRAIAARYDAALAGSALVLPPKMDGAEPVYHQYVVQAGERDRLRERLQEAGVATLVHYPMAVHQQAAYADPALRPVPLPATDALVPRILSLPMFPELGDEQVEAVVAAVLRCL